MKRITSLCTVAAICAAVYVLDPLQAAVSSVAKDCYGWPHDPDRTISACENLITRDISDAHRGEALFYIGLAHDLNGDDARALDHYDRAETLRPNRRAIYVNRASLYVREKLWDPARADATRALALAPDAPGQLHWTLAFAAHHGGHPDAALSHINRHIERAPDSPRPRRLRLSILRKDTAREAQMTRLADLTHLINAAHGDKMQRAEDHLARLTTLLELRLLGHASLFWDAGEAAILKANDGDDADLLEVLSVTLPQMHGAIAARAPDCAGAALDVTAELTCITDRYMAGDVDGAIERLQDVLKRDPTHPEGAALATFIAVRDGLIAAELPTSL